MIVYEDLIRFLSKRYAENPAAGYGRQAFEYAERAKARALLDSLAEAQTGPSKKISPELREEERRILAKISNLQKRIAEQPDTNKALEIELLDLKQAHESLRQKIRRNHPEYADVMYPEPVKLEAVQKLLDNKTALLEYVLGQETSLLFVVTRNNFRICRLNRRDDLEKRVDEFSKSKCSRGDTETEPPAVAGGCTGPAVPGRYRNRFCAAYGPSIHLYPREQLPSLLNVKSILSTNVGKF